MRWTFGVTALGTLLVVASAALALEGKNGHSVTQLFSLADAQAAVTYDAGFSGVRWQDMDSMGFGPSSRFTGEGAEASLATDAQEVLYMLVHGFLGSDSYTGVIAADGSGYRHIAQDEMADAGVPALYRAGGNMRAVTVVPVAAGQLAEGDVVVVRTFRPTAQYNPGGDSGVTYLEVVSIDPATGSRTLIHSWESTIGATAHVAVDSGGSIFVLQNGVLDASGNPTGGTIQKLTWDGTGYDEATLATGAEGGLLLGPDGDLYTFADHAGAGWDFTNGTKPEILRVDRVTGASSSYAEVDGRSVIHDWSFDSAGSLWVALDGGRKKAVGEALPGGTVTAGKGTIASWTGMYMHLTSGGEGRLYAAETDATAQAGISLLEPSADGDSGGGGKGGGKGKPR